MDYRHELAFGSFLTPDAADPHHVVELAGSARSAASTSSRIQDHPYQARHADAWTLLSVIAARERQPAASLSTSPTCRCAQPVVLAKTRRDAGSRSPAAAWISASARRVLGPRSWRPVAPRLTRAQSVDALREGIEVIRGVWRSDGRSVRVDGEHHRVVGLHPGRLPRTRSRSGSAPTSRGCSRLTGRYADGWLPSMGYADPDALPA